MQKNANDNQINAIVLIVQTVFLILKLAGLIHWSWWWVFSPLWIPVVFMVAVLALVSFYVLLKGSIDQNGRRNS